MSDSEQIRLEVHSMRNDVSKLAEKMGALTEVLIRKEESDKYLERRIEKLEAEIEVIKLVVRKLEDSLTRSTPIIDWASKVFTVLSGIAIAAYFGFK
jgi:uncharacterized coiled-coil protein SlyX